MVRKLGRRDRSVRAGGKAENVLDSFSRLDNLLLRCEDPVFCSLVRRRGNTDSAGRFFNE